MTVHNLITRFNNNTFTKVRKFTFFLPNIFNKTQAYNQHGDSLPVCDCNNALISLLPSVFKGPQLPVCCHPCMCFATLKQPASHASHTQRSEELVVKSMDQDCGWGEISPAAPRQQLLIETFMPRSSPVCHSGSHHHLSQLLLNLTALKQAWLWEELQLL